MKISLTLDKQLVKQAGKIAREHGTTLVDLVRDFLRRFVTENAADRLRQREALERSFTEFQFRLDQRTWSREGLHHRGP